MALIWKEHLSVGNALLDSEHKNLLGLINGIEYKIDHNDVPDLLKAIELLKRSAQAHFANEARFAQALNLDFEQHGLAHQHLLKELDTTFAELESRVVTPDDAWCKYAMEHYPKLLRDWFIEHITGEDMKMKPALQSYPCDFKPA